MAAVIKITAVTPDPTGDSFLCSYEKLPAVQSLLWAIMTPPNTVQQSVNACQLSTERVVKNFYV